MDPEQGGQSGSKGQFLRANGGGHDMQKAVKAVRKK